MNMDRVTITGADDTVNPKDLLRFSREFPFVEWGILVSASSGEKGAMRFPSHQWLKELLALAQDEEFNLSLHLCGRWVRELLLGNLQMPEWMLSRRFQRVQLNFHAERTTCKPPEFTNALRAMGHRPYIFQIDGNGGNAHMESVWAENEIRPESPVDAIPLFDISGGAGVLPSEWPKPIRPNTYHGYAGGLGPENLEQQIPLIAAAAGDCQIWIDMETRVRSAGDRIFDLEKVYRCLQISKGFSARASVSGFHFASPICGGCYKPLLVENAWMHDGCPCNSPLGVNSTNETRWRLLIELQQQQSRELEALRKFKSYVHRRLDEAGIPTDPDSPHKAEGCRIGGRLDIVLSGRGGDVIREMVEALEAVAKASKMGDRDLQAIAATRAASALARVKSEQQKWSQP